MTAIPGVQVKRDDNGELTHIEIDVRQHKEAIPVLQELGLLQQEDEEKGHSVEELYNAFVMQINNSQLEKDDDEEGHTIEESKAHVYTVIRNFYESNH